MLKIVAISDTHGRHRELDLPDGDILIHSGDMSRGRGSLAQITDFNDWLGELKDKYKFILFTPGNHDFPFERTPEVAQKLMSNCTFLQDSEIVIEGTKFYASPWQPWFYDWAFNLQRGPELAEKWSLIPDDTDVLITHGPPYGHNDFVEWDNINVGCKDLLERIMIIQPIISIYGHIHQGYGISKNEHTTFVNASNCGEKYNLRNPPVVIEIDKDKRTVNVINEKIV